MKIEYPTSEELLEVSDYLLEKNHELYRRLAQGGPERDRTMFYSHGIKPEDKLPGYTGDKIGIVVCSTNFAAFCWYEPFTGRVTSPHESVSNVPLERFAYWSLPPVVAAEPTEAKETK